MVASSKPGPDTVYFEAGSQEHLDDLERARQRSAEMTSLSNVAKNWAPWVIGGLLLAGVVYYVKRD